jgi:formylglycine-generating enzyme required for sulfatase activity
MAGNVAEWCWDFYDDSYGAPMPLLNNPHGPDTGKNCVVRGGSWRHTATDARCANRFSLAGDQPASYVGFRVVRGR